MRNYLHKRCRAIACPTLIPKKWVGSFVAVAVTLMLGACAQDAWHSDDGYDAFLDQVRTKCWDTRIGSVTIPELMPDPTSTDDYFMDVTSRFYHGQITRESYLAALGSSYNARPDASGIRCLLDQMPQDNAIPPSLTKATGK